MAVRHPRPVYVLCMLLIAAAMVSCIKVRSPGIMPSVQDPEYSEWEVLNAGFAMIRTSAGEKQWKWQIVARYIPQYDSAGISPLDLSASVDGVTVPFTFEEDGQIFESMIPFPLSPGKHRFELAPSPEATLSFPTLTVDLEAP